MGAGNGHTDCHTSKFKKIKMVQSNMLKCSNLGETLAHRCFEVADALQYPSKVNYITITVDISN